MDGGRAVAGYDCAAVEAALSAYVSGGAAGEDYAAAEVSDDDAA